MCGSPAKLRECLTAEPRRGHCLNEVTATVFTPEIVSSIIRLVITSGHTLA
jgi:hypothetical protein